MDDFSDYLCTVCGEPIGREPYFAAFNGRKSRIDPEPLWPESVFHRRCMGTYLDGTRGAAEPS
jgi:hypothetical protein